MIESLMLIDDNAIDQKMYKRLVDRSGLVRNLFPFMSAEEALEFLRKRNGQSVSAILLDINMPRMDGFEFLEAATRDLGNSFADIVVVMITTSVAAHDKERAREFAVVKDYVAKPLGEEDLRRIDQMLMDH